MKGIGIALILAGAVMIRSAYISFVKKGEEESAAFLALLEHIYGRISCYVEPVDKCLESFASESLENNGFLPEFRSCKSLSAAFDATRVRTRLPKEAEEMLTSFFSGFGGRYMDGELKAVQAASSELKKIAEKEKGENEKRCRVATAVIISAALGFALLLL